MGFARSLIKNVLMLFNLIVAIAGLGLLGLGVFSFLRNENLTEKVSTDYELASILVICIGCIVFLIAFLGCWGAMKFNRILLLVYAAILIILLILQIGLGIYAFITITDDEGVRATIKKELYDAMKNYDLDQLNKDFMDTLQSNITCCGCIGPSDWGDLSLKIPPSCCANWNEACDLSISFQKGCAQELYNFLSNSVLVIGYVTSALFFIELLPAIIALYLRNKIYK